MSYDSFLVRTESGKNVVIGVEELLRILISGYLPDETAFDGVKISNEIEITLNGETVSVQPFSAMQEVGVSELIGKDEQVDEDYYSGSVGASLGGTYSGEILDITLYSTKEDSGSVQTPAGTLIILDADPAIASGDTAMTAAEHKTVIGQESFLASDWKSDAGGAQAHKAVAIAFHSVSTLYFVWLHEDATSFNDGASDDEVLEFNAWYRRDS